MLSEISKTVIAMDPESPAWHPGCQSRLAVPTGDVERPRSGRPALLHIRDAAAREPDTNVGWWVLRDLRAEGRYTFSCDIFLPGDFAGGNVRLCLGYPLERDVTADLLVRDRWQTLSLQLTLPFDLDELGVILRVDSEDETSIYSSDWTLECVTVDTVELPVTASPLMFAPVAPLTPEPAPTVFPTEQSEPAVITSPAPQIPELIEDESLIALARAMADGHEPADLGLLVSAYTRGGCSYFDYLQHQAMTLIDEVARRFPGFDSGESLFDGRAVRRDVVAALCPELLPSLYLPRNNQGLEQIPLLEPSPNELMDDRLPSPVSMLRHLVRRPAVVAYATADACIYVDPCRYQALSRDRSAMWLSGSPRGLSREAIGATELIEVDKDVVILQDRFNFITISHFLLDGVSRALLLAQALGDLRSSLLVFGGFPGEFHAAIAEALRDRLNLAPENILFPDRALTIETTRRCFWFSDQVETYLHPAQMAHPSAIASLRSIVEALPGEPSDARRLYLPHYDVAPSNAEALRTALEERGFVTVPPDDLSIAGQVGLYRGAETIVAAHGPHLTHLIAAGRLREVIELYPPSGGSDAYGLIAAAGGIRHSAVIGSGDADNYDIDIDAVVRRVGLAESSQSLPSWHNAVNLLPGSQSMRGLRSDPNNSVAARGTGLVAGNAVVTHRGAVEGDGSVVGLWPGLRLIPGLRYTASCWVYIPEQFAGVEILLHLTGAATRRADIADMTRPEQWQKIELTAIPLAHECDLELRLTASGPASFSSTCWQLERGDPATAYIATP